MNRFKFPRLGRKGSPLVEEGLLIGLSIIIILIFASVVMNLVGWAETSIVTLIGEFQHYFQNLFSV